MPPAFPGLEMCGSTATSNTSTPAGRYALTARTSPEAPPKAAARAATTGTRATTATTVFLWGNKSASHRHNQLQLGLSKQKHKDRQAIPSSHPSLDTPAKPADYKMLHYMTSNFQNATNYM